MYEVDQLRPYGAFEVKNSSWIRLLERRNRVHSNHSTAKYLEKRRHFILTFHDSMFECVARRYESKTLRGNVFGVLQTALAELARE